MAELTPTERLQPSLLDRLTDDEPEKQVEARDRRVLSLPRLRESVLRDLGWLLNTCHLAQTEDLEEYPQVQSSVLNYGVPDYAGSTMSGADLVRLERALRQAILDFEPRILRNSLRIRAQIDPDSMTYNALTFVIEGELWSQPLPERLYLRTQVDLESGHTRVDDDTGRGGG